jgi:hypothetical protein
MSILLFIATYTVLCAIIVAIRIQPHIVGNEKPFHDGTRNLIPVSQLSPPLRYPLRKEQFIIEQNPNCWIGVPGATCGPERTYY